MPRLTRGAQLTAGLVAAAFAAGAFAGDAAAWAGAAWSHRSIEKFDMSVGVTAGQAERRAVRFDEARDVYAVPAHYGTLVSVTGDARTAVLWYRDNTGLMRNVVLADPAQHLYEVRPTETSRFEADAREH